MSQGISYQPALDGLRALAVVLVLVFHADLGVVSGGYVGVSVFFTLSGFLITRLLHRELLEVGRIDIGGFISRRARRLVPASALCLIGVALAARAGLLEGVTDLRRDLLGSAFQVQNWVLLASGESYTDLLLGDAATPSPLDHYWSLAIEEQFYWIWPAAFVGLAAVWGRRPGLVMGAVALVAAVTAPVVAVVWGPDAAYWATPARLAEILVGAWLAIVLANRRTTRADNWRRFAAPAGLGAVLVAAVVLPSASGFAYQGGLPLIAVASTLLILGLQYDGPVTRLFSTSPAVAVGRVSYGLYLYHWPVYVILDEGRVGLDGVALLGVRLAVTIAITVTSFVLVEQPVRRARWKPAPTLVASGGAVAAVVVAALVVPSAVDTEYWRLPEASGSLVPTLDVPKLDVPKHDGMVDAPPDMIGPVPVPPSAPVAAPVGAATPPVQPMVLGRAVRILVVGDSTAEATGVGLVRWAAERADEVQVGVVASPGFALLQSGVVAANPTSGFIPLARELVEQRLPEALEVFEPDLVMLMVSFGDLEARQWDDEEGPSGPDDPRHAARLRDVYVDTVRQLVDTGAEVVLTRTPAADPLWLGKSGPKGDSKERRAYDAVLVDVVRQFDDGVHLVDLRAWLEFAGLSTSSVARPDGVHWDPEMSTTLASEWLGPLLAGLVLAP